MVEHCISALRKRSRDKAYRIYVTDALMYLTTTTAMRYGGKYLAQRYLELIEPPKAETRTEGEVISDLKRKIFQ